MISCVKLSQCLFASTTYWFNSDHREVLENKAQKTFLYTLVQLWMFQDVFLKFKSLMRSQLRQKPKFKNFGIYVNVEPWEP